MHDSPEQRAMNERAHLREQLADVRRENARLETQLAALRGELARLQQENDQLRTRALVAEQHKTLSLLGKSSWQEVVEEKLRIELAETQVRAEAAESALSAQQAQIQELVEKWQETAAGLHRQADSRNFPFDPTGSGLRHEANTYQWCAHDLAALLIPETPSEQG